MCTHMHTHIIQAAKAPRQQHGHHPASLDHREVLLEAVEHGRKANMLLLEAGAVQVALTQISVGGPITGSIVQVAEYADMHAWAESSPGSDRMTGNPAWQELVQVALAPDGPLVADSLRINILTEIQL